MRTPGVRTFEDSARRTWTPSLSPSSGLSALRLSGPRCSGRRGSRCPLASGCWSAPGSPVGGVPRDQASPRAGRDDPLRPSGAPPRTPALHTVSEAGSAGGARPSEKTGGVTDPPPIALLDWLRSQLAHYAFDVVALYRDRDDPSHWPLRADGPDDLRRKLGEAEHFLPLPKEPAALANIIEVSLVDFLMERAEEARGIDAARGTERGYPDLEFSGDALGGYFAVDVKVARRKPVKKGASRQTQSRITLYTGNTYFRYPTLHWPGTFRPFADYAQHLDVIAIYTLDEERFSRVADLEIIVQEPWRIGSRQRSSTTREYLGAVTSIDDLREGRGEFATEAEFYAFWRKHPFRIGRAVQQQLDRLIAESGTPPPAT